VVVVVVVVLVKREVAVYFAAVTEINGRSSSGIVVC